MRGHIWIIYPEGGDPRRKILEIGNITSGPWEGRIASRWPDAFLYRAKSHLKFLASIMISDLSIYTTDQNRTHALLILEDRFGHIDGSLKSMPQGSLVHCLQIYDTSCLSPFITNCTEVERSIRMKLLSQRPFRLMLLPKAQCGKG